MSESHIVLSACCFGSIYLFSTSLISLNERWMRNQSVSIVDYVNGSIMFLSGSVIAVTTYKALRFIF